jgi:hypothetical protein
MVGHTEGIRISESNRGKKEGYEWGGTLSSEEASKTRGEVFAEMAKKGKRLITRENDPNFHRDDVVNFGLALMPRVQQKLADDAVRREQEQKAQARAEMRRSGSTGFKF